MLWLEKQSFGLCLAIHDSFSLVKIKYPGKHRDVCSVCSCFCFFVIIFFSCLNTHSLIYYVCPRDRGISFSSGNQKGGYLTIIFG